MTEFEWLLQQQEGQFFERKSCYERSAGAPRRRDVRAIAQDVAETLAAMANADGGSLAVGLEDKVVGYMSSYLPQQDNVERNLGSLLHWRRCWQLRALS